MRREKCCETQWQCPPLRLSSDKLQKTLLAEQPHPQKYSA
jgi:hypothetical protein